MIVPLKTSPDGSWGCFVSDLCGQVKIGERLGRVVSFVAVTWTPPSVAKRSIWKKESSTISVLPLGVAIVDHMYQTFVVWNGFP